MSDRSDLLPALGELGLTAPAAGDAGDAHVRAALQRAIDGRRLAGRRLRLPFGGRSIALLPATILAVAATAAAAAGTLSLLTRSATTLFQRNPAGLHDQTVIAATVRRLTTFTVPGIGPVQYWVAATRQHGLCEAMRLPNETWAVMPGSLADTSGVLPGCAPTRRQQVIAQGNSPVGLLPTSVDDESISLRDRAGDWFDVYFGVVDADRAHAVLDPVTHLTAPLIDGRYFVLVVPRGRLGRGACVGCDHLRAINSAGQILPADYGPPGERNH